MIDFEPLLESFDANQRSSSSREAIGKIREEGLQLGVFFG